MSTVPKWIDAAMEQAQVFASAWSLLGTQLDDGNMREQCEAERSALLDILVAAAEAERQVNFIEVTSSPDFLRPVHPEQRFRPLDLTKPDVDATAQDAARLRDLRWIAEVVTGTAYKNTDELVESITALQAAELLKEIALWWALYHSQGGSSAVGQPIRKLLGIGRYDPIPDGCIEAAKKWAAGVDWSAA